MFTLNLNKWSNAHELAEKCEIDFETAWMRITHVKNDRHIFEGSEIIEKQEYEKHPHSSADHVYVITLRKCKCGLIFQDKGLEYRHRPLWAMNNPLL